mgnify:CR=1 FL=1
MAPSVKLSSCSSREDGVGAGRRMAVAYRKHYSPADRRSFVKLTWENRIILCRDRKLLDHASVTLQHEYFHGSCSP